MSGSWTIRQAHYLSAWLVVLRRSSEDTFGPPAQMDVCVRLYQHTRARL